MIALRKTLTIALLPLSLTVPLRAQADPEVAAMTRAQSYVAHGEWTAAAQAAHDGGRLAVDVVEWERLRAGEGQFAEYFAFLRRHPDWPGLALLQVQGERKIDDSTPAGLIRGFFQGRAPRTSVGSMAYQAALVADGNRAEADLEAKRAWLQMSYSDDNLARELALHGRAVRPLIGKRLDLMLWQGRLADANQLLPLASKGEAALARARIALQNRDKGVDGLLAAVPRAYDNDPGLAHDRFTYRMAKGYTDRAVDLLLERSRSAKDLGDPAAWARVRAGLARQEMDGGDARKAYRIAASSHLTSGGAFADLEFLAGYIALRKLNDPKTALQHFRNLRSGVSTPISLSRAAYWMGRAEEALGHMPTAMADYRLGAQYPVAFYGLLSAERAGIEIDPDRLGNDRLPDWHGAKFLPSSLLQTALLLHRAGDQKLAKRFFLQLADGLNTTERGQLADLALAIDDPNIAVLVAKKAAETGDVLARAYFPLTKLAHAKLAVPADLALAIARRESEFDAGIVSPAGALGLMQLMPATAKRMSAKAGLSYDKERLTSDPTYNAKLGSTYLAQLIDEFGPALTLVAAGYNAGPNRAKAWIQVLGDPRDPKVDPVDWIESVPFTETRDYIMRVAESYEVYRAKLAGRPVKVRLTAELKGR